jgi:HAE1 family hydrophobic/amphiphilic exporter-1
VQIDRGVAGQLGVSIAQIAQALRPAFAGVDAGTWVDPAGESRYVRVRLAPESRENIADVSRIPLILPAASADGPAVIPLGQVARFSRGTGPAQITHLDRHRVITVGANIQGASLGEVTQGITRATADIRMPPGYRVIPGGQVESQQEVFGNIFIALGIAVMLMYLILVVQFESFLDPLAILVSLPLSLIGVVLALIITRFAEHHEPDRRDPADGHRGEERHSADRFREVGDGARHGPARGARGGGAHSVAPILRPRSR